MRVLMTADPIGGVWSYAVELCGALAKDGTLVSLATLGGIPSAAQQEQLARLSNVTLFPAAFRLEWMPDPWSDLARAGEWLLSLEKALRPDIIHLNHLVHADLPWRAPVLSVGHSCVLSWWSAVRGTPVPPDWAQYRRQVTRSLRAAQCVVAPTAAILGELERHYGPFHSGKVIHNGRDHRHFGAAEKERFVLSAGRMWDPAKNIAALAAIAPAVSAPIVIAGELESPYGRAAYAPSMTMLGHLEAEHLARWYGRAAVYALPARYEPFGLTALEAALSGCALVLGDIDTLREVWGPAARYVHPDRHEDLRDTLNELLANEPLRLRLSARARTRARQFTPGRFAQRYLSLYRNLCGGGRRHRVRNASRGRPVRAAVQSV
jgi:glycogen synthase